MNEQPAIVARNKAPILFRVAKDLDRRGIRGSTRLLRFLLRTGRLEDPVDYPLEGGLKVMVPIARNQYDRRDLDEYESEFLATLSAAIREVPGRMTLIDVGADIGLFSLKLIALAPSISAVVAYEPSSEGFRWLQLNLGRLEIPATAINGAAADFEGTGQLIAPDLKWSPGVETNHTQYFLESTSGGPINVSKIDSLTAVGSGNLIMKVDVEGGERAVLRGASRTIAMAANVIVAIEAHPSVTLRTGVDAVECMRLLSSFRPFRFYVGETGLAVNTDKPFFEQVPPDQVYNIVARSH